MYLRLAALVLAALALWVGIPVGWLWVGSQVQSLTDDLGAAIAVMFAGAIASAAAVVFVLGFLTKSYQRARVARGREDTGSFPLEVTLVCTAGLALAVFLVWFLVFAGAQPCPLFPG